MLLSAVLQKATGKSLINFAKEALFDPLGITDFAWTTLEKSGEAIASGGLRLRPRDMAKIGQLMLNNGTWNGRRIVSQAWMAKSSRPYFPVTWMASSYGYQSWIGQSNVGERTFKWVAGWGWGDNAFLSCQQILSWRSTRASMKAAVKT